MTDVLKVSTSLPSASFNRITAVVAGDRLGEFVDGREVDGLVEVEPL